VAAALGGAAALGFRPAHAGAKKRLSVIEMFTSQGCSSCPPADELMGEFAALDGVVALTFNVDYWDYLGWRDTLASSAHSQRQYAYAKARGDMDVYTPQAIIDGRSHYVGSRRRVLLEALERSRNAAPVNWVEVTIDRQGQEFLVGAAVAPHPLPPATLWVMGVAPKIAVKIEKGENAGREILYYNVVRSLLPVGMWHGEAISSRLPWAEVMKEGCSLCVALLQTGTLGPVIGAARWSAPGA
jgi:hypothetical protein